MRRMFGASKNAAPPVTLGEATQKVTCFSSYLQLDTRVEGLEEKIKKLDAELFGYREKMKKMKPGTGGHNALKQRALKILKQKKM